MKARLRTLLTLTVSTGIASAAGASEQENKAPIVLRYDFHNGTEGWIPGFSDYHLSAGMLQFRAENRRLPVPYRAVNGYYLQSRNTPDDLFMFVKREMSTADGLQPNGRYRVSLHIAFLSNAPSGAVGVGGAPGEGVVLKAGISRDEPVSLLDGRGYVGINIDKGSQENSGKDAQIVSTIANGLSADEEPRYVLIERYYELPEPVQADERGILWAIVGTESGFEGLTGLFYRSILITLRPATSN
jgi:hypothetical protein